MTDSQRLLETKLGVRQEKVQDMIFANIMTNRFKDTCTVYRTDILIACEYAKEAAKLYMEENGGRC